MQKKKMMLVTMLGLISMLVSVNILVSAKNLRYTYEYYDEGYIFTDEGQTWSDTYPGCIYADIYSVDSVTTLTGSGQYYQWNHSFDSANDQLDPSAIFHYPTRSILVEYTNK